MRPKFGGRFVPEPIEEEGEACGRLGGIRKFPGRRGSRRAIDAIVVPKLTPWEGDTLSSRPHTPYEASHSSCGE